jgi:hypothetical protein
LPQIICANLIVDMAVYFVTVSSVPLLEALRAAGIVAEWVLPSGQKQLQRGDVILRAYKGSCGMEMKPSQICSGCCSNSWTYPLGWRRSKNC